MCLQKTPPESFCCSRWLGLQRCHATPIQPREQRLKLCRIKPQDTVEYRRPFERHDQAGPVPPDHLEPISAFGAEHINHAIKRLLLRMVLHQCRQAVVALAEARGLSRYKDLYPVRRMDRSAAAISAIRAAGVSAASRTVTSPLITSRLPEAMIGGQTTSNALGFLDLSCFRAAPSAHWTTFRSKATGLFQPSAECRPLPGSAFARRMSREGRGL